MADRIHPVAPRRSISVGASRKGTSKGAFPFALFSGLSVKLQCWMDVEATAFGGFTHDQSKTGRKGFEVLLSDKISTMRNTVHVCVFVISQTLFGRFERRIGTFGMGMDQTRDPTEINDRIVRGRGGAAEHTQSVSTSDRCWRGGGASPYSAPAGGNGARSRTEPPLCCDCSAAQGTCKRDTVNRLVNLP